MMKTDENSGSRGVNQCETERRIDPMKLVKTFLTAIGLIGVLAAPALA
ncbi:MAG: hypothetical protein V6Z86_03915 [Hyphomicrobiales bacterium]